MKLIVFYLAAAGLALLPTASSADDVPDGYVCPQVKADFKINETTDAEVRYCFGKPMFEKHNPDGSYSLMFKTDRGVYALLFGPDGLLRIAHTPEEEAE